MRNLSVRQLAQCFDFGVTIGRTSKVRALLWLLFTVLDLYMIKCIEFVMVGNLKWPCGDLKIISWNINGIRSFKNLKETLDDLESDIICLQETKVTRDMIDEPTALVDGYNAYFSFSRNKSGYSGVATFCRERATPTCAEEGLSGTLHSNASDNIGHYENIGDEFSSQELKWLDSEGRSVITQHKIKNIDGSDGVLTIFNVYCPRADPEKPERLDFKLRFYKLLELRANSVKQSGSLVMIVGDVNTSHQQIDRCENIDQDEFEANPSRQWLNSFLVDTAQNLNNPTCTQGTEKLKMVDSFRYFHPNVDNAFTCWNTKINARATNYGSRIDYILVDGLLIRSMEDSMVLSEILGSDHCPVAGGFNLKPVKSIKCPSASSKYFPEFSGVQQKLSYFFEKNSEACESSQSCSQGSDFNLNHESHKRKESDHNLNDGRNAPVTKKAKGFSSSQTQILHFFGKSSSHVRGECGNINSSVSSCKGSTSSVLSECNIDDESCKERVGIKDVPERIEKSSSAVSAWRNVLCGPRPPPLCKGHREPCVERTVKKKGANLNRKFFACARGEGSKTDPRARCDHFEWAVRK